MTAVLVPGLDLRDALVDAGRGGAAFVPAALDEAFREALLGEVASGPFEPAPDEVGPVRQRTVALAIREPFDGYPLVARLREALQRAVRRHGRGIRGLVTYRPNEADAQRYRPGPVGITPHLDGKRFRRLVVVFTLGGSARFTVHERREGPAVAEWDAGEGSMVLLRAPGLCGVRDGRPFHAVAAPASGERISLGFRMNTRPE